jgi:hypothetical protein
MMNQSSSSVTIESVVNSPLPASLMTSEPSLGKIASLRMAFMILEHVAGTVRERANLACVKHAILKHLADYDADLAIIEALPVGLEKIEVSELPGLMWALDLANFQALQEATANIPLQELD